MTIIISSLSAGFLVDEKGHQSYPDQGSQARQPDDGGLGELVIEVETHDGRVVSRCRGTWEGEHETFGDAIKTSISLEADRLPLV